MRIIEKTTQNVRAVDWSKPVVVFDPWPFREDRVQLGGDVLYWDGYDWSEGEGWALDGYDNVLGVTTLGETFVSSRGALDKLS